MLAGGTYIRFRKMMSESPSTAAGPFHSFPKIELVWGGIHAGHLVWGPALEDNGGR